MAGKGRGEAIRRREEYLASARTSSRRGTQPSAVSTVQTVPTATTSTVLTDWEQNVLPTLPNELQEAYAMGGVEGFNEAVDIYNKRKSQPQYGMAVSGIPFIESGSLNKPIDELTGTIDESKMFVGGEAGKSLADAGLVELVESGATVKAIWDYLNDNPEAARGSYAAGVLSQIGVQFDMVSGMEGQELYTSYQTLGVIPVDAAPYIEGLPAGSYFEKDIWEQIPEGVRGVYLNQGYAAGNKALDHYIESFNEAVLLLKKYDDDPVAMVRDGHVAEMLMLFSDADAQTIFKAVGEAQVRDSALKQISDYLTEDGRLKVYEAAEAKIPLEVIHQAGFTGVTESGYRLASLGIVSIRENPLAGYEEKVPLVFKDQTPTYSVKGIARFLRDRPSDGLGILQSLGFTGDFINTAQEYNNTTTTTIDHLKNDELSNAELTSIGQIISEYTGTAFTYDELRTIALLGVNNPYSQQIVDAKEENATPLQDAVASALARGLNETSLRELLTMLSDDDLVEIADAFNHDIYRDSWFAQLVNGLNEAIEMAPGAKYLPLALAFVAPQIGLPLLAVQAVSNVVAPYTVSNITINEYIQNYTGYLAESPSLEADEADNLAVAIKKIMGARPSNPVEYYNSDNLTDSQRYLVATEFTRMQLGLNRTTMDKVMAGAMVLVSVLPFAGALLTSRLATVAEAGGTVSTPLRMGALTLRTTHLGVTGLFGYSFVETLVNPESTLEDKIVAGALLALVLRAAYDSLPAKFRANLSRTAKQIVVGEGGFARLSDTTRTLVRELESTGRVDKVQARELSKVLRDIEDAIRDNNPLRLYDAGKNLARIAKEIGEANLQVLAEDIVNNPRGCITEWRGMVVRSGRPEDMFRELTKIEDAVEGRGIQTETLTAKDVGLTEEQFAEFLKLRARNPDLTVEQFKKMMVSSTTDWDAAISKMLDDFNQKLKEETTNRQIEYQESDALLKQLLERIDKRLAEEKEARVKRARVLEEIREWQVKKAKEAYDPEYAREVGEINKEIIEHLSQIKDKVNKVEETRQSIQSELKVALQAKDETKVAELTELLEQLENALQELQQEQTETETELQEATQLLTALQVQTMTETETETATLTKAKQQTQLEERLEETTITGLKEEEDKQLPIEDILPDEGYLPEDEPPTEQPPEELPPDEKLPDEQIPPDEEPPDQKPPEEKPPEEEPPDKDKHFRIKLPSGGGSGIQRVRIPVGSIAYKKGLFWKYIPPSDFRNGVKPRTLPPGVAPVGAVISGSNSPYTTIQIIGKSKAMVPETISVDEGVVDAFISNAGGKIAYSGGGLKTDVGSRLPSPTQGMSVGRAGINRPEMGTVYPKHSISRTAMSKELPPRKAKKTSDIIEQKSVTSPYFDEDEEWLESLEPLSNKKTKSKNRTTMSKSKPRRKARRDESLDAQLRRMTI